MTGTSSHEVTELLDQWRGGDDTAAERLFPLVYDELRKRARGHLQKERPGHTLQATALVHEAYLRLASQRELPAVDRLHFLCIASRVMRRILVDHARGRNAAKRAHGVTVSLDAASGSLAGDVGPGFDILELDDAIGRLEKVYRRKSQVVDMKFFAGMQMSEIAEALGVTEKTVQRDWQFAKLWLYRELANGS
jgi:RNA polymerase sigma factor (TIGR02999 family)